MLDVPVLIPATTPDRVFTKATAGFVDDQAPPDTELVSVVFDPGQTDPDPPIAGGNPITDTDTVLKQPAPRSYVITATPAEMPVIKPVVLTESLVVSLLDQEPPPTGWVSVPTAPTHKLDGPAIAANALLTVICRVTTHPEPVTVYVI